MSVDLGRRQAMSVDLGGKLFEKYKKKKILIFTLRGLCQAPRG